MKWNGVVTEVVVCPVCGERSVEEGAPVFCAGSRLEGTAHLRRPMVREPQFDPRLTGRQRGLLWGKWVARQRLIDLLRGPT